MPRTPDFTIAGTWNDVPRSTRATWLRVRKYLTAFESLRAIAASQAEKIREDGDLNDEARARKLGNVREGVRAALESEWEGLQKTRELAVAELDARVQKLHKGDDPLAPRRVDLTQLSDSGRVLVEVQLATHEASAATARLLLGHQVQTEIDQALVADPSGDRLRRRFEQLLAGDDRILASLFERRALERLELDGKSAQAEALRALADDARERRLPPEGQALLDHRDELEAAFTILDQVALDAKGEAFLESAPSLRAVELGLAPKLEGLEGLGE